MPEKLQPRKCKKATMDTIPLATGQVFYLTDTKQIFIDTYYEGKIQRIEIANAPSKIRTITGTFSKYNWKNIYPYSQTVTIDESMANITKDTCLAVDLQVSSTAELGITELTEWEKISRIETTKGKITAYCYTDTYPGVDLNFIAKEI